MRHILSKYNLEGKAPFLKRSTTRRARLLSRDPSEEKQKPYVGFGEGGRTSSLATPIPFSPPPE